MVKILDPHAFMNRRMIYSDAVHTTAQLRLNGKNVGVFMSENRKHAEAEIKDFFDEYYFDEGKALEYDAPNSDHVEKIDIFITRSPCYSCAEKLLYIASRARSEMKHFKKLRVFCATVYKGESNFDSINSIGELRGDDNIRIYRWDVIGWARNGDESAIEITNAAFRGAPEAKNWRQNPSFDTRLHREDSEHLWKKDSFGKSWRNYYHDPEFMT